MKDKNGIEICCENCDEDAQSFCVNWNPKFYKAGSKYCIDEYFAPSSKALKARIAELQIENALLKDGESHVMDVKMSPKFVKSIIRTVNSEIVGKTEWQSETVEVARPSARTEIVADTELFGNGRREQFEKSQQKEGNTSEVLSNAEMSRQPSGLNRQAQVQFGRSCTWWDRDPADQDGASESQLGRVADGVPNRVDRLKAIGNGQVPLVEIGRAHV